jgi:hypothetical protein
MPPQQWRKFIAWCGFSVLLPLIVYLAVFVICLLLGIPGDIVPLLARGDLLFLAVVLLTMAANWSVEDMLLTPQTQVAGQTVNYALLAVTLLVLVLTTIIYGWLLTLGLSGATREPPKEYLAALSVGWLVSVVVSCGAHYLRLLSLGRI